jgi:hypothetical protein
MRVESSSERASFLEISGNGWRMIESFEARGLLTRSRVGLLVVIEIG